jgi:DNA primase
MLAERIAAEIPALATTEHRIGKRRGKIYLDYMRNAVGQTAAAAYSLRPWPGATVSTPLAWIEVKKGLRPERFTIKTIFKRLRTKGDLRSQCASRAATWIRPLPGSKAICVRERRRNALPPTLSPKANTEWRDPHQYRIPRRVFGLVRPSAAHCRERSASRNA